MIKYFCEQEVDFLRPARVEFADRGFEALSTERGMTGVCQNCWKALIDRMINTFKVVKSGI